MDQTGFPMHSLPVYSQAGQPTGESVEVDLAKIAEGVNKVLLHDAVVMYQANLRVGTAKTKSRAEISGSGKKMYKQKGTGNARMGNKRTPVRRGGGHCFAKRPKDWGYRLPAKALKLATRMAILSKFVDDQVTVVDSIKLEAPKTKTISGMVKTLGLSEQSCLIAIDQHDPVVWKSCRNIARLSLSPCDELNAHSVLSRKRFVITKAALNRLLAR
jgi:large subunit ribosomal protein L4